jgi:transcriptional regulator with XRE-family HTH domain
MRFTLIKFRRTREKGKRSIKYFAEQLDITRQHYSDIESGKSNPSFGLMERFYEVFEDELIGPYSDMWLLWKKE